MRISTNKHSMRPLLHFWGKWGLKYATWAFSLKLIFWLYSFFCFNLQKPVIQYLFLKHKSKLSKFAMCRWNGGTFIFTFLNHAQNFVRKKGFVRYNRTSYSQKWFFNVLCAKIANKWFKMWDSHWELYIT